MGVQEATREVVAAEAQGTQEAAVVMVAEMEGPRGGSKVE